MFEVRVLGDVAVIADGGDPIRLRKRELELIGMLSSRFGRLVAADVLIEALWGDDLPQNPTGALHTAMSRLRTAIGKDGDRVATVSSAYRLDLEPEQVDAHRFEELVARAEGLPPGEVSTLLDQALSLWTGSAYTGLEDNVFLAPEVARLEQLRLTALEDRIRADLQIGRRRGLIAELTQLTEEHPYNEGFWGLLMEALYGSGRQNEALAAFQRARYRLSEDLGLEPGPALRRLEESILLHDRGLRTESVATGSLRWLRTPAPWTSFVGREDETEQVRRLVRSSRLVTITGIGGIGKSRLAFHVAQQLTNDYIDGVGSIRFDKGDPGGSAFDVIAGLLGVDSSGTLAIDRLVDLLRGRELLLVVDGAEGSTETADLVQIILGECPGVTVLAASRVPLSMAGETVFALGPLGVDGGGTSAAVELFVDRATARDPSIHLDAASGPLIESVVRQLDGVPLAIELAALRAGVSLESLADEFRERLDGLVTTDTTVPQRHRSLVAALDGSFDALTPRARMLLDALSFFRSPWTVDDAVAVSGADVSEPEARSLLGELVASSLVTTSVHGAGSAYTLLSVVRTRCRESLGPVGFAELASRHAGVVEGWSGTTPYEFGAMDGMPENEWVRRLEVRLPDVLAAFNWMIDETPDRAAALFAQLRWFWFRADLYSVAEDLARRILLTTEGWSTDRAWVMLLLGGALEPGGDLDWTNTTFSVPSLRIRERQRRHLEEAHRGEEAVVLHLAARAMFERVGDHRGRANAQVGLIGALGAAGRLDEALEALAEARDSVDEHDPEFSVLVLRRVAFDSIVLHLAAGEMEQARAVAQAEIDRLTPDANPWVAIAMLDRRARVARAEADQRTAIALYRRAIVEYAAPNNYIVEALLHAEIGFRHVYLLEYDEAMRSFGSALRLGRAYGLPRVEPWVRIGQALAAGLADYEADVETYLDDALRKYTRFNDRDGQALVMMVRVVLAEQQEDFESALDFAGYALRLRPHDALAIGHPLRQFARRALADGDAGRAARLWGASIGIRSRAGLTTPAWQREDDLETSLRETLGSDEFTRSFDAGVGMSANEAIDDALELV